MTHLRENSTGLVHGDTLDGNDYALCGMAMEGENGDDPMVPTNRKITCERCLGLIAHCKAIPARKLGKAEASS